MRDMEEIMKAIIRATLIFTAMAAASGWAQTTQEGGTEAFRPPRPRPSLRISEDPSQDSRNLYGFSLGVLGFYDSNLFGAVSSKEGGSAVEFLPGGFANFRGGKSILHVDYQFGYRMYAGQPEQNMSNQNGTFEYLYRASRRTTFTLWDHAHSGPNDILSFTSGGFVKKTAEEPILSQQILFDNQRMWFNSASGRMSYQSSRRNRFQVSGQSQIYRYRSQRGEDTNFVSAGVLDEYQFTRNWSCSIEASNGWVNSARDLRNGSVLLALAGLKYQFGKHWVFGAKIGGGRTDYGESHNLQGSYEASLARTSPSHRIEFRYARRPGYQLGLLGGFNQYDTATLAFDQRLSSRTSFHFLTRYYRPLIQSVSGNVVTVGGNAGVEFAVSPTVVATMFGNYLYQRQRASAVIGQDLFADRYIIVVGAHYVFSPVRRHPAGR
jgi:hypothetical protein